MNFRAVYAKISKYFSLKVKQHSEVVLLTGLGKNLIFSKSFCFFGLCFTMFTSLSLWCMLNEGFFTTCSVLCQWGFWEASFTILRNAGRLFFPFPLFSCLMKSLYRLEVAQILPCCSTLNFVMIIDLRLQLWHSFM